jgi:serine/threonine protein kinase
VFVHHHHHLPLTLVRPSCVLPACSASSACLQRAAVFDTPSIARRLTFCFAAHIGLVHLQLQDDLECIIIHRDIKPENLMIDGDRGPQIIDFGMVRVMVRDKKGGAAGDWHRKVAGGQWLLPDIGAATMLCDTVRRPHRDKDSVTASLAALSAAVCGQAVIRALFSILSVCSKRLQTASCTNSDFSSATLCCCVNNAFVLAVRHQDSLAAAGSWSWFV